MGVRISGRMAFFVLCAVALSVSLFAGQTAAQDIGSVIADRYTKKVPVTGIDPAMTMEDAAKVRAGFLAIIMKDLGEPVGYKAGLTNPAAQKAFGISQPVRGTILRKMLIRSGSTVPPGFGTRPFSEGDLIVRVGDDRINEAKTPEEALKYLDAVIPCIELADLVYDKSVKLTGPAIVAINVGPRFFVLGEPIGLKPSSRWMSLLKDFTVAVYNDKNELLSEGKGEALLGHPLNVALWIRDSLAAEGAKLRKGDLLSLGTVTKMIPPTPGSTIRARYTGLDPAGPVDVLVRFE